MANRPTRAARIAIGLLAAFSVAVALLPATAGAATQASTSTSMQTSNGCAAGSGQNCTTYANTTSMYFLIGVTSADGTVPSGTVTVYDSTVYGATGNAVGTTTLDSNGDAVFQGPPWSPAGQHYLHATYNGDAAHASSSSALLYMDVQLNYDQVSLNWSSSSSQAGQPITYSIAVAGNEPGYTPSGTVDLYDQSTLLATAALVADTGQWATTSRATVSYALMTVGSHYVYASYAGDSTFEGGASPSYPDITVTQATPALSLYSSSPSSTAGQPVTFTAVLSGAAAPTGSIAFSDGGSTVASVALANGQASWTSSTLTVGSHTLQAAYGGDANNAGATSAPVAQTVSQAATSTALTTSQSSAQYWYPITLTATVSSSGPAPTGSVTFYDGTTSLGTVTLGSAGRASLTVQNLGVGQHNLTAAYSGDTNASTSTSAAVAQTVTQDTTTTALTSSATSVAKGKSVTLTATVSSSYGPSWPTGTVTFYSGTTAVGTASLVNGVATLTASLPVGTDIVKAVYGGSPTQAGSTSNSLTVTVSSKR